jgi:Uma2 family endonuclease
VRLDLDNEPQPDALLRIEHACGGQARVDADGYLEGAPELLFEVAASSASYDLHSKPHAYRRNGAREYVVWRVLDGAVDWFVRRGGAFELLPAADGILTSATFPGLWLDVPALLSRDLARVLEVVRRGTQSQTHATFVAKLAAARK